LPSEPQRVLLVFHLAGQLAAIPLAEVESVASMAQLARPPGLPLPLEGILNRAGKAVPVWRLDRLLQLPEQPPGLYSMMILLKGDSDCRTAMLVDRVSEILSVPESALVPVDKKDSFNACAEAEVSLKGQVIHLLSTGRILLEQEREALSEFQAMAQRRLQDWEAVKQ
jgi:purine-binding chemotaxis protein CheW